MPRTSHQAHADVAVPMYGDVSARLGAEGAATGPLFAFATHILRSRAILPDLVLPRPSAA